MTDNTVAIHQTIRPANMSIEAILLELKRYGYPKLSCMDNGKWVCYVKMRVGVKGADFEISSEFGFANMRPACEQCLDRVIKAVETIGNKS